MTHPVAAFIVGLCLLFLPGCGSLTREVSKSPRTAIEQILLAQSVQRSLADLSLPLPPQETMAVEAIGLTQDQEYVRQLVIERLGDLGYAVQKVDDKTPASNLPHYRIRILLDGLGTEQGTSFFGMPPVQSIIIPIALPKITIYEKTAQRALIRLALSVYRYDTNRLIGKTPWYEATTYYDQYVVLLFLSFFRTDLTLPPQPL